MLLISLCDVTTSSFSLIYLAFVADLKEVTMKTLWLIAVPSTHTHPLEPSLFYFILIDL